MKSRVTIVTRCSRSSCKYNFSSTFLFEKEKSLGIRGFSAVLHDGIADGTIQVTFGLSTVRLLAAHDVDDFGLEKGFLL